MFECLCTYQKRLNDVFTSEQDGSNGNLSLHQIVVNNLFGPIESLWGTMSAKVRWSHSSMAIRFVYVPKFVIPHTFRSILIQVWNTLYSDSHPFNLHWRRNLHKAQ